MRITHINVTASSSHVDGVRSAVDDIASAQSERGHEIEIVDASWAERHNGWDALADTDVVHLHSVFRPQHIKVGRWCLRNGIPYVLSPHSGLAPGSLARQRYRKALWITAFDRRLLTNAATVVCLTPAEQDEVRRVAPSARTVVVPNLASMSLSTPTWTPGRIGAGIVTLARFDVWQKGLDRLAEVARLAPDIPFRVYGEFDKNDPRGARRLIRSAPSNLTFTEPVYGEEKARVLTEAGLYFQPSRWEGMSLALLEAFVHGTPCAVSPYIATSLGGDSSRIAARVSDDPNVAAAQLRTLLADPERLLALSRAGRSWAQETTNADNVIGALIDTYQTASTDRITASEGERL